MKETLLRLERKFIIYVLVATIKEKKKTEVITTTKKKIFQIVDVHTASTTTITNTAMGKYLGKKV